MPLRAGGARISGEVVAGVSAGSGGELIGGHVRLPRDKKYDIKELHRDRRIEWMERIVPEVAGIRSTRCATSVPFARIATPCSTSEGRGRSGLRS